MDNEFKVGFLRRDEDDTWFLVPEEDIKKFDALLLRMYDSMGTMKDDAAESDFYTFATPFMVETYMNFEVLIP